MLANMPTMATTTINSMSVTPRSRFMSVTHQFMPFDPLGLPWGEGVADG